MTTAVTGNVITASIWNTEFAAIATAVNSIDNSQIASNAAIAYSKLALTGNIVNADISASAAIDPTKIAFSTTVWVRNILSLACSDMTTGTAKDEFTIPAAYPASKFVIDKVELEVDVAPGSSKTLTVDVNKGGATILSSPISITGSTILSANNAPSVTAVSAGDRFTIDIDTATSGLSTTRLRLNISMKQYLQTS